MSDYDNIPCSIQVSGHFVQESLQPIVIEDFDSPNQQRFPQQPSGQVRAPVPALATETNKKLCLSTTNQRKEPPAHPALRRKTVAFGRTVNVSQTVEGTSRQSKKALASSSATSSPIQNQKMTNEPHEENWKDVLKSEMEAMRKELQEKTTKQLEELNSRNMNKVTEMMTEFCQQITVAKQPAYENTEREKENRYNSHQSRKQVPTNKIGLARETLKRDGILTSEAINIIEQRIRTDPMVRQQLDDVLADAEYDANRANYSPSPPLSETRYTNGVRVNPALMRETLTVERSIRYENGLSSVNSRQWATERNDNRTYDNYRPYEAGPPCPSMYQKGQSISYYPSETVGNTARNRRDDYFVEDAPDEEEEIVVGGRERNYHKPARKETEAEKEKRIREKWSRKK